MYNLESIVYVSIILYTTILLLYYGKKYKDKTIREFKTKSEKLKILYLLIPTILLILHNIFSITINFYNDFKNTLGYKYDQRFYLINNSKYTQKFLVTLYDSKNKIWIANYRNDFFRFSPIIELNKKVQIKSYVFLDKINHLKYNKIGFIYLNDNDRINDTLMNSIIFELPSPPIKVYSVDFYKNKLTKRIKINNTFEYIKLLLYIVLITLFVYLSLMSKHQYLKYIFWVFNIVGISACIYLIYECVRYLLIF